MDGACLTEVVSWIELEEMTDPSVIEPRGSQSPASATHWGDGMARVSAERREEYLEGRRELLIDAALAVLSRDGFDRATMAAIAEEAGTAKGTIYNYFQSKEDVLAAVLCERTTQLERILEDNTMCPEATLTAIAHLFLAETLDRKPGLARLVLLESPRFPSLAREMLTRLLTAGNRTVAAYLDHQASLGRLRVRPQPEATSMSFFAMLVGYLLAKDILAGGELLPASREEYVKEAVDIFLNGLAQQPQSDQSDCSNPTEGAERHA